MKTQPVIYIVTSKPGMVPYSKCHTEAHARQDAWRARQLGLDGEIVVRPMTKANGKGNERGKP